MDNKTKVELQSRLIDFLNIITKPDPKIKNHFICPFCGSGTGKNHTGALSVEVYNGIPRAKCFAHDCVNGADIFDICGKLEGLTTFPEQAKKVMKILNYNNNEYTDKTNKPEKGKKSLGNSNISECCQTFLNANDPNYHPENGYIDFYEQNRYNCSQTDYLQKRGISEEVIQFEHIGYCTDWKHPKSSKMKKKTGIIIPISKNAYVFRDIKCSIKEYRYFRVNVNTETNSNPFDRFFGFDYLTASEYIFIVEGEIDALSVLTTGHVGIALGSTANAVEFVQALEKIKEKINKVPKVILFLDNDDTGIETTQLLLKDFKTSKDIEVSTINYSELEYDTTGADPNKILQALGKEKFKNFLSNAIKNFKNKNVMDDVSSDGKQKYSLNIKQYLAEYETPILQLLRDNKKSLLVAPMGTGKTRLIKSIEKIIDPFSVLVIVNPSTKHLLQMEKDYEISAVCAGFDYMGQNIVGVTPESLRKKVINKLQRPFTLIVDEAHSIYSDFNFRKAFADVKEVEKMAEKVIYMTATPDILYDTEDFNCIIEIDKTNQVQIATEIIEIKKLNIENIVTIIKEELQQGAEFIALHNDDKNENNTAIKVLNEELQIKTMIDPCFQENILNIEPRVETHTKNTATAVDASQKDNKVFKSLIEDSTIDEDIKIFCTTSCIQAGININNQKETTIIYVCNNSSFRYTNFLQATGRYRNREKIKKIILIKTLLDPAEYEYKCFLSWYEETLKIAQTTEPIANFLHKNFKEEFLETEMAEKAGLIFDKENDKYVLDEIALKAKAYAKYNKGLLHHPQTLKKKLEDEKASKLKVSIIQREEKTDIETKEALKRTKKEKAKIFNDAVTKMFGYDDQTVTEILTHNVDRRKIENIPLIEIMEDFDNTVSQNFKNLLKKAMKEKELNILQAFKYIQSFEKLKDVENDLKQEKVKKINRDINEKTPNTAFEIRDKEYLFTQKIIFIRYMLQNIEKKQGYIGDKTINTLADEILKDEIYNSKTDKQKIIKEINELIKYIYNFKESGNISSVKIE